MIFLVVLVTIGLFHVSNGAFSSFCKTDPPHSNNGHDYFKLDVNIPSVGTYDLRTFNKLTSYTGYFQAKRRLESVIIQARTGSGRHYGIFYNPDTLTVEECIHPDDSLVGSDVQPRRYTFTWQSDAYSGGDIQFWVAIQDGQNYTWMAGPKYRASTDYDSNTKPRTGESTAHKIYYIVVPAVLLSLMIILVGGSIMVYAKVKYGTVCCCADWDTPISYRYARKYAARQRQNLRNEEAQPPSYDNVVQEEDKMARQNVARYEMTVAHDLEDITDDRAPLTGP